MSFQVEYCALISKSQKKFFWYISILYSKVSSNYALNVVVCFSTNDIVCFHIYIIPTFNRFVSTLQMDRISMKLLPVTLNRSGLMMTGKNISTMLGLTGTL